MKQYFEGWYFKHQNKEKTVAIIPGKSMEEAFIHVVTDEEAYFLSYPLDAYQKGGGELIVGANTFSESGLSLNIDRPELRLEGAIKYGKLTPIDGDIMGPFRFFPMECSHGIVSMQHDLVGTMTLNDEVYNFNCGVGYIESDSGTSFPSGYSWVHCNDFEEECSIVVAVARIPFYGLKFWGCICVIHLNGKEYRLATYKGVRIIKNEPGLIEIKQGKYRVVIQVDSKGGHQLPAPRRGKMDHTIVEDLSCRATFKFTKGNQVLFEETSEKASYEYHEGTR